jgi:hypothetical protein
MQYALNVPTGTVATAFSGTQTDYGCSAVAFLPPAAGVGFASNFLFGF